MEILAAITQDAARQQALARGAALALVVLGLGVAVFTSLVLYAALRRHRAKKAPEVIEPTQPFDAWQASADRIKYEKRADQYEDDDDDDEAGESTWYEEDEGPDDDDSYGSSMFGHKPPNGGPPGDDSGKNDSHGGDFKEDDSFGGDDIPGSRLDF